MAEIEMQKRLDSETYHAVKRMLPTADELREGEAMTDTKKGLKTGPNLLGSN